MALDYESHPARRGDGSYILKALAGGIEPERRFVAPNGRMPSEAEMLAAIDAHHLSALAPKQGLLGERPSESVKSAMGRQG